MHYKYRGVRCSFRQMVSAFLATAIPYGQYRDERDVLRLASELIAREDQCMSPTQAQVADVLILTCGQVEMQEV